MSKPIVAILCGGKGKRLRPKTLVVPKAMVPVNGKPILDYILDYYIENDFKKFVICTGYKSEVIEEHCEKEFKDKCEYSISNSGENASMLQRIYDVKDTVENNLMLSYGDTLTELDDIKMLEKHKNTDALVTIATASIRSPFGLVNFDNTGHVESFKEKPLLHYYIGHAIFKKEAFDYIDEDLLSIPDGGGLVDFYKKMLDMKKLFAYEHEGFQITFNTETDLADAEKKMDLFYTVKEE